MIVNPAIFKAYDIRGIFPTELNEQVAYGLGRAFVTFIVCEKVIVGRDMRLSGPALQKELISGLTDQGADVLDIGMVSTDQFYYACGISGLPGLMVTASHNPKAYNGFKMVKRMPYLLSGDQGIQEIRQLMETENYPRPVKHGQVALEDFCHPFVNKVLSMVDIPTLRPLKVVVDTGNGMVGPILKEVYRRLPVELIGLYLDPDGNMPNHGLDPLQPENRRELQERVIREQADVGFAFDGDGDRFFTIDDRGQFVAGDFLTAIMSSYLLEKSPASKIIYDVRASWAVPESIQAAGGTPLMERVGHSFIKRRMAEEGALFAGEVTGHYYFRDFFSADTGIVPSLIVMELLSRWNTSLSALLKPLENKYFISGEINSTVSDPSGRIQALLAAFPDAEQHTLDGISIIYPSWHFNIRPSNTEPLLRLNLEAKSQLEMENHRDEVLSIIRK
jgi:phosphomannomutase